MKDCRGCGFGFEPEHPSNEQCPCHCHWPTDCYGCDGFGCSTCAGGDV